MSRQFDYVMTGKVRLLLFWTGRDDVGGGYIRFVSDSVSDFEGVDLKMGSDPSKAPRRINRWGAATEVRRRLDRHPGRTVGAFFGFMKASRNETLESAQAELDDEGRTARYVFRASINRLESDASSSGYLLFHSDRDFDLNELDEARELVLARIHTAEEDLKMEDLLLGDDACSPPVGFLLALKDLTEALLSKATVPEPVCYVHNAKPYLLAVREQSDERDFEAVFSRHDGKEVTHRYHDVSKVRFETRSKDGEGRTSFRIWIGRSGPLRGVPIRIEYQPNWWFRVILNLDRESTPSASLDPGFFSVR